MRSRYKADLRKKPQSLRLLPRRRLSNLVHSMKSDESPKFWLHLFGATVFVALLSSIPLPIWLLLPIVAVLTFVIQEQVFHTRILARSFWLTTYLHPESPIRPWLTGSKIIRWLAVGLSLPLSIVTYITVYSYGLLDCFAVAVGIFLGRQIHRRLSSPIDVNLAEHLVELAHLRIYYWLSVLAVLICLAISSVAKGLQTDYSQSTSGQLATIVIDDVKHPVRFVQHCVRTLRFTELQLLRVRDINGWPYGWLIYLFFLVPNAIPAFGLVTLYAGGERLLKRVTNDD